MSIMIRKAKQNDLSKFIDFSLELSKFNRSNHKNECKYDDYNLVKDAIREKAISTFEASGESVLMLIAEFNNVPVGYLLARVYEEEQTADNGTGMVGLIDEVYINELSRGLGIGKELMEKVIRWIKEKKITRIKLHAYNWNINAKEMYKSMGFNEYAISYEKYI